MQTGTASVEHLHLSLLKTYFRASIHHFSEHPKT